MIRCLRILPMLSVLVFLCLACSDRGLEPLVGEPITGLPRELSLQERQLVQTDNQFALKLFQKVNNEEAVGTNVFISPLSAALALGMTYNGAAGTTEAAMRATLGLGDLTSQQINESYRALIDLLRGLDPVVRFQIGNSIWYRQGFAVEAPFLDMNKKYFDARIASLAFSNAPAAANTVNDWVKTSTNGLIPAILDASDFDPAAVMFLVNAIYFKGAWTSKFDKARTSPGPFTLSDGSVKSVPMMHRSLGIFTSLRAGVRVIDLPYGGGAYSMTILLPPANETADALTARLDDALWAALTESLSAHDEPFSMPRFKLEYGVLLNQSLKALGMGVAFTDAADFTRINRAGGLQISKVKQKAFVDVNEEGTEAAAATSVGISLSGALVPLDVNRPFIFAIREKYSGAILFLGKIADPSAS